MRRIVATIATAAFLTGTGVAVTAAAAPASAASVTASASIPGVYMHS